MRQPSHPLGSSCIGRDLLETSPKLCITMHPMYPVSFGTSGHRGIIGKSFTIRHVKAICWAISTYLKKESKTPNIAVGYDPRQGNSPTLENGSFTKAVVDTLLNTGCNVHFMQDYTPTPTISWYVQSNNLDGGLILTASHNPPNYNGLKFNSRNGAPATTEITEEIEILANNYLNKPIQKTTSGFLKQVETTEKFCHHLKTLSESLTTTHLKPTHFVVDVKYGSCAKTWQKLALLSKSNLTVINKDPLVDYCEIAL